MTKQLVELMEGVLGVDSTVGVGSEFWVELRSTAAPDIKGEISRQATPLQTLRPTGVDERTLLYIEDNPANMQLVEQLIARRPDIKLLTAVNGSLGIEQARSFQPDVILMDINLPGISGIDALKILREDPSTAHIPIVAISANAMLRDIELGIEIGFFRYLTKPIIVEEFMETLNVAFEFAKETANLKS